MTKLAPYLKALVAAVVAGLSVLLANTDSLGTHDYLAAAIAFLVGLGAVFAVPNATAKP